MVRRSRKILLVLCLAALLLTLLIGDKLRRGYYHIWLPAYISQVLSSAPDADSKQPPLHIVLAIADHFEPGGDYPYLRYWLERYRGVVARHSDSYGNPPQRTFFYPIEQFDSTEIEMLLLLCRQGYAEIELQLHHFDDDSLSLTSKLRRGLDSYSRFGICQTSDQPPLTRFAFVHGNWALDNSQPQRRPNPCGVDAELLILASFGCYLDVTFPAILTSSQPSRINSIYYATDDGDRPKSYDDGLPVEVGKSKSGDLMLWQGPLLVAWNDWRFGWHPAIENGDVFADYPLSAERIPLWLQANVHVLGQPNWIFVKLHSHGAHKDDSLAIWGPSFDQTLTVLETDYNDGDDYLLHYVTVREAYNIIKAAEAGHTGDPEFYRDYLIKQYKAGRESRQAPAENPPTE